MSVATVPLVLQFLISCVVNDLDMLDPFNDTEEDLSGPPTTSFSPTPSVSTPMQGPHVRTPLTGLPAGIRTVFHSNTPLSWTGGTNLLQKMDKDQFAEERQENIYFPFASRMEWDLASWLSTGGLSQKEVDSFLKLDYVSFLLLDLIDR